MVPVIPMVVMIFVFLFVHRQESIHFHVVRGEQEKAMVMIRKLYPDYNNLIHDQVYEELREALVSGSKPTITNADTLCGREYRSATWVCLMVALANTLAGINLVNQYATTIYSQIADEIRASGNEPTLNAATCVLLVGIIGFFASLTALCTIRGLTRRKLFIGGHSGIAIALVLCIIFKEKFMIVPFLVAHGLMLVSFQGSNGAGFWVYAGEVANEVAMGISLFVIFGSQFLLSALTPLILANVGVSWFLAILLIFQILIVVGMTLWLKETKGLDVTELYNLYRPADMHKKVIEIVDIKANGVE